MIWTEAEKIVKYKDLNDRNTAHVECTNISHTGNKGKWNHFE